MNQFEMKLENLHTQLIEMGSMIEQNISDSILALQKQDASLAKELIERDAQVNDKEKTIEALCLQLLLRYQPVARDLRQISACLKMITDLERIGDHAADIASITIQLAQTKQKMDISKIMEMSYYASLMVKNAIDAFVDHDLNKAIEVEKSDDKVDQLFYSIKKEIIEFIKNSSENGEEALDYLLIAKYLERIGDHSTNVSIWAKFAITGNHN